MRKRSHILLFAAIVSIALCGRAFGAKVVAQDANAEADLQISLNAPSNVSLQIGGRGSVINTVNFFVTSTPEAQPVVRGDFAPAIEVRTNSMNGVVLTSDSSSALTSTVGTIPFSVISFSGTGDFSGASGKFDGTPNQMVKVFGGKGVYQGTLQFSFSNSYNYSPGTYTGTVTFTATAP